MGERLPCTQEAIGSNPFTSTNREKQTGGGDGFFCLLLITDRIEDKFIWVCYQRLTDWEAFIDL